MTNKTPREDIDKIVKEYQPQLKSFIRKRVQNKDDADDILQDVLYQLVKTLDNVVTPIEQAAAWLYRVARNTIINKGKKMHEEELPTTSYSDDDDVLKDISEILFSEDNPTPETEYLRSLVWQELEVALSELPPEQREAFELTELEGLPVKDVAKTIGVSINTLLSRKHYAVKHLRNRLEGLYKDLIQS